MSGRSIALAILLAAGSVAGGLYLLGMQFADGSAYPEYSSLRSDALGAKLLFDTLALVQGTSVTRNYLPLEYVKGAGATVLVLDLKPELLEADQLGSVDQMAARGNRVVVALAQVAAAPTNLEALAKMWKVRIGFGADSSGDKRLYFGEATGWKTISEDESKAVAIERAVGKGSVVLFAGSEDFANERLADTSDGDFPLISTAIGPYSRVIFDEQHFGIAQTGSVVGLVRRFRLTGMALGFAICAALFVWRNVTAFPPPEGAREVRNISGRTSQSGLLTLLRRHVPLSELASVCWNEWLTANRRSVTPARAAQAEEAIRSAANEPVKAMREIQSVLHSKGTL